MTYSNKSYDAYYGLDAHQKTISVARALPQGESEYVTTLPNRKKNSATFSPRSWKPIPEFSRPMRRVDVAFSCIISCFL